MNTTGVIVMKFGGTSMKDAETIRRSAGIAGTAAPGKRVVAVVSAMDQVTELLLEAAAAAGAGGDGGRERVTGALAQIRSRHERAAREIGGDAPSRVGSLLDELDRLVAGVNAVGELTARSKDAVVAYGEMLSTALMGAAMACPAFTGREVGLVTNEHFGKAEPLMDLSLFQIAQALRPVLEKHGRAVVSGFIAATQHGATTTFGRGGSDYTACIVGAALKADEVWVWSDVDGLMSADPRVVPNARLLPCVSFAEAIEMGQFGAKSMHPLALEPAAEHGISVRFRNTFNTASPGTLIAPVPSASDAASASPVKCCLLYKNAALINITGAAMIGRPGTAAQVFRVLADAGGGGVNIMMISQTVSEAGISLVVSKDHAEHARTLLERTLMRTGVARAVAMPGEVSVVAAVGGGMHGTPGIAAKVFSAVAAKGINVMAIAQGSSELSISFVVEAKDGPEAVRALHAALVG